MLERANDGGQRRLLCKLILAGGFNFVLTVIQEDLTSATTKKVLDAFARGEKPKPGPQESGRFTSENSAGLTALTSKVSRRFRNFICMLSMFTCDLQPYGPGEHCTPEFA
jgi:NADH dehydrogenase (ubiquinone) flavoprotein 2